MATDRGRRRTFGMLIALWWAPALLPVAATARAPDVTRRLLAAKAHIMDADYRADLAQLARSRADTLPLRNDARHGHLAHYWCGYASWRIAMNGVSRGMPREAQRAHLAEALVDFDSAARLRPDFADALAAAASVRSWLATFSTDAEQARAEHRRAGEQLARALQLAPDNPRVLWVQAGEYLFKPAEYGGDAQRAIAIYRRQAQLAATRDAASPQPDWGVAEAWMSLAFAHAKRTPLDLAAAREEALHALRLQPDWWYVRDVLLPEIDAAAKAPRT